MSSSIRQKKGRQSPTDWLVFVVPLFLVAGFVWYNFSHQGSSDQPISEEPPADSYARTIPAGQLSKSNSIESNSDQAVAAVPAKFDSKEQKRIVQSTLLRRYDENSARESKDELSMPEWEKIINPGGTLKDDVNEHGMFGSNGIPDFIDLYRGVDAEFIQENISDGTATDMSALLPGARLSDEVLYNGAVRREHDLGNAYVLAAIGADNHLRLYAAVERLVTDPVTFIEFEFNQESVRIGSGSPWPIIGKRNEGDLLVRMVFSNRILQSVQLEKWQQGGFKLIKTAAGISGNSCQQRRDLMYCTGTPPIRHPEDGFEVWDENYNVLEPTLADNFVEVGIDVDLLAGPQVEITTVLFRTPEDIAINNFQVFRKLAQLDQPVMSRTDFSDMRESAR